MATQSLPSFLSASTFTLTAGGVVQTGVETVVISSLLPTQALPNYLSASTFTETFGGVETVGVTTVNLPLTYFGPSIPLGTDWTFGGSTSPASTTQSSSLTPTAIPSSSSSQLSSSSSVTASTSISSSSPSSSGTSASSSSSSVSTASSTLPSSTQTNASSSSSTSATSSPSISPVPIELGSKGLSTGQLIGIIIASIVAAIVIIMLFVLWCYRRQRHRSAYEHPNLSDFVIVDAEGQARFAGEGVPRTTGEEEDSFLRRSSEATNTMREVDPSARLVSAPSPTGSERTTGTTMPPEGVIPTALKTPTGSPSPHLGLKTPSPFFHASASSLFFNPSRGTDLSLVGTAVGARAKRDSASTHGSTTSASPGGPVTIGNIIPPRQLLQMDNQWRQESGEHRYAAIESHRGATEMGERTATQMASPLRPPPILNTDTGPSRQSSIHNTMQTIGSHLDSPGSDDERATLLLARHFNMSEGGRGVLINVEDDRSSPSNWHSNLGLGLGGLARLSRLSWFQRIDTRPIQSSRSRSGSPMRHLRSDHRSSLLVPRPVSNLTTSSTGDTVYYDAASGPSSTSTRSGLGHNQGSNSMPPLLPPRAVVTPEGAAPNSVPQTPRHDGGSDGGSSVDQPALLMLFPSSAPASPRVPTPPNAFAPEREVVQAPEETFDILDTPVPAPAAISPFSTTSTRGGPVVPPGLEHIANIRAWRDSSSDMPSSATFGTRSDYGMNIDVVGTDGYELEDAPPRPREGWTLLRSVTATESSRRTLWRPEATDEAEDIHSTVGSLHSIPDGLSPLSPVGSGANSRAPSRHTQYNSSSLGSGESRFSRGPSPLSGNGTSGSSGSQLGHSNSNTSEGRRRPRREPGEPLSLSPASSTNFRQARLSAIGGHRMPMGTPQRSPTADGLCHPMITGVMTEGIGSLVGRTT
ncbi:hypothetical protein EW145_g2201 [Phellinidium pouzarii]|uniref:REJ domain-containing protein n=1 Tax=Phellinidium pouzarii TaxID=167371 RepID=A0A4S4LBX2_9AGAM|nr:hypothetical protein EW145_g2201 [Phellinidium pouzarii]